MHACTVRTRPSLSLGRPGNEAMPGDAFERCFLICVNERGKDVVV